MQAMQTVHGPEAADAIRAAAVQPITLLRISGPDAASFLQGQITHDTGLLANGRTLLAACNTPQGRVLAVLRLRQAGDEIYLAVPADVAAPLLDRLRRYVLRAKVRLERDARVLQPVHGTPLRGRDGDNDALRVDWSPDRALVAVEAHTMSSGNDEAGQRTATIEQAWSEWQLADIAAGLPQVDAATSGQFVAQMLNLDLLDGISFTKGCYTGQEIVARTQNLGRIKRRLMRYAIRDGAPPVPMAALHRDATKVGEVLMAAPTAHGCELLAVTALDARDRSLTLDDGRVAEPLPLPYAV
jgi:tRNA-modifying protein YgfZ